jgi:predicted small metal-binding protein
MRRRVLRSKANGRVGSKGGEMRAIECPCGHHLVGADDEELFRLAREHVHRDHPEMQRSDEQLRARIAADAYDA